MYLEEEIWVLRIKQPGDIFIHSYPGGRLLLFFLPRMDTFLLVNMPLLMHRQAESIRKPLWVEGLEGERFAL